MAVIVGVMGAGAMGAGVESPQDEGATPDASTGVVEDLPASIEHVEQAARTISAVEVIGLTLAALAPLSVWALWRLARSPRRDVSAWPWWCWLVGVFAVLAAQAVGAGIAMSVASERAATAMIAIGASLASGAAGLAVMRLLRDESLRHDLAARRDGMEMVPRWADARGGVIAIALVLPIVQASSMLAALLYRALRGEAPPSLSHETLQTLHDDAGDPWAWAMVGAAVLGAPLAEEIIFRGLLQSSLLRLIGRPRVAVAISAALFSLAHLEGGIRAEQAHALIPLFVLGLALGAAYERTARLWVPIVMHMLFNAFNVTLTLAM
ncbi:MAG: lysostaphin resistance A-like protein [Phycisphaerales bacterium]